MKREELVELQCITPIANVPSILAGGLLSHRRAAALTHTSVANTEVQARRANKKLPSGLWLHEYVNLYFCARNTMLYVLMRQDLHNRLCVLRISTDVLDIAGALVTDRNAASTIARFAEPTSGLTRLEYGRVFAQSWIHEGDIPATDDHRQVMCAEALIPHRVGPEFILGAFVPDRARQQALLREAPELAVTVNNHLFFK